MTLEHIVIRGDAACCERTDGRFPFVDLAAEAGATGVHLWFLGERYREVAQGRVHDEFIPYCHDRNMTVHLGVGVGAYGVCDGEDPTRPGVRRKILEHVARTLDEQALDGVEFQTGEYDYIEYQGTSRGGAPHAARLVEALNPVIEFAAARTDGLWIRTELRRSNFAPEDMADVARGLDCRCTVEWSEWTGPYRGDDAFEQGRGLLALDDRFSLFLKTIYNGEDFWKDLAPEMTPSAMRPWVKHWRGWVKLLREAGRPTLTICHVPRRAHDERSALLRAAVALARDPERPTDEMLRLFA